MSMGRDIDAMDLDSAAALRPVFLEPRDDYWLIHAPDGLSIDDQREYRLAPKATADQLETAVYCENCFPRERRDSG